MMTANLSQIQNIVPTALRELRNLRKLLVTTIVPPFFILTICSSLVILWALAGPNRVRLRGPPSVQLYYVLIAIADVFAVITTGYTILGNLPFLG